MIAKLIRAYGMPMVVACDAQCDKAWGITERPKERLSDDEDDVVFLADGELGTAPAESSTTEGGIGKPQTPEDRLNRWCFRACERSQSSAEMQALVTLPDWSKRRHNQPWKHAQG